MWTLLKYVYLTTVVHQIVVLLKLWDEDKGKGKTVQQLSESRYDRRSAGQDIVVAEQEGCKKYEEEGILCMFIYSM
jgi:hypothetical protein